MCVIKKFWEHKLYAKMVEGDLLNKEHNLLFAHFILPQIVSSLAETNPGFSL